MNFHRPIVTKQVEAADPQIKCFPTDDWSVPAPPSPTGGGSGGSPAAGTNTTSTAAGVKPICNDGSTIAGSRAGSTVSYKFYGTTASDIPIQSH